MIHTFGDSHCYFGWNNIPNVKTHHLGPKLCFSVGRDGIDIKDGYCVNEGDTVVFCFGEIDCRCNIHKYVSFEKNYKEVIDYIVDNYFAKIKTAVDRFINLKTFIYNVVPPIEKYNTDENPDYPFLGTDDDRKSYVLYFNEKLQAKCLEYNYIFFNIYSEYTDKNGFLNKSLSDGNVHILDGIHIKNYIKDKLC